MSHPRRSLCALLLALCALTCGPASLRTQPWPPAVERCLYDVEVRSEQPLRLEVTATCSGRAVAGLHVSDNAANAGLSDVTSDAGHVERRGAAFWLRRAVPRVRFRYGVDLERVAAKHSDPDAALRTGRSLITSASVFLLHPLPLDERTVAEVRVRGSSAIAFATGLVPHGAGYRLQAHEIPVATYCIFGRFERSILPMDGGRARLEMVLLDGAVSLGIPAFETWIRRAAEAVAGFYGAFPVPRVLVAVVPVAGERGVVLGKVVPESGPGIVVFVGTGAQLRDLAEDWILVHELLHLGVPSFHREGKWLDEGLATYFEPLVRARAGLLDERALWSEFVSAMPGGLRALARAGLAGRLDGQATYWGGASLCLYVDASLRERSRGRLGLEHGLRRVRNLGGSASEVWQLDRMLRTVDEAFPSPALIPLVAGFPARPSAADLRALFGKLGVSVSAGELVLRDDAELAWVRRALIHGVNDGR